MDSDAQVRRQGPRRGRPDQHKDFAARQRRIDQCRITGKRKLHIDRRAGVLVIFNFSFSQRGLVVYAPVDGAGAFVNEAAFDEAGKQPSRLGFVMVRHGDIGIFPLAQDAEPLKITRLSLQSVGRKFTTSATDAQRRHVRFLRAQLAFDVQLDRQSVTVIAGNVRRVITQHRPRFDDEVF